MRGPGKRRHSEGQAGRPLSRSLSSSTKPRHANNRRFQKRVVNQVENGHRHHHLPLFGGSLLLAVCFRTFSSGRENGFVGQPLPSHAPGPFLSAAVGWARPGTGYVDNSGDKPESSIMLRGLQSAGAVCRAARQSRGGAIGHPQARGG
jgi:hypothetical protein